MLIKLKTGLFLALLLLANVSQAGIWAPSNPSVSNFFDLNGFGGDLSKTFGIFEDTANTYTDANALLTFNGGATLLFNQVGSDWNISINANSATLIGSSSFQLGYKRAGVWETEITSQILPWMANAWQLTFGQGQGAGVSLYALNVMPSAVPLPTAAWLMLSSLMGVLLTSRRKAI